MSENGLTATVLGPGHSSGGDGRIKRPLGLAVRRDATLVLADSGNHRLVTVASSDLVTTIAGNGIAGHADGTGRTAQFRTPLSVAVTALDEVVVADTGNHCIRLLDRLGQVSTLAGGEAGYVDGDAEKARFNGPSDVAVNATGHIIVADLGNNAIRVLDLVDRRVRTLAGTSEAGDQDGPPTAARFRNPSGLAVDLAGHVYVADAGNASIRRISPDGNTVTIARLAGGVPADVAVASDGTLYVTDTANHRILRSR